MKSLHDVLSSNFNVNNFFIIHTGSGESGKSTILKQLKLIHKIELKNDEKEEYKAGLKRNALQCMNILTEQVQAHDLEFEMPESKVIIYKHCYHQLN